MNGCIIGIAGVKNSGKDTVASMINYIFNIGFTAANYADWCLLKRWHKESFKNRVIHFADGLKDALAAIYPIPRSAFDDRNYKDNLYYDIKKNTFIDIEKYGYKRNYVFIDNSHLEDKSLREVIESNHDKDVCIKLRTLMQYFGTDVCRDKLSHDIFVNTTMIRAKNISKTYDVCLMPDVRFKEEADAIHGCGNSLYGVVVMVKRNDSGIAEHISEQFAGVDIDYIVENKGSLLNLFYVVLELCKQIAKKIL